MVRGQKRKLPAPLVEANIHNRFDVEVVDAGTGEVKQKAYAENMILNTLWGKIGTEYFSYIQYGTGAGTPAAARTSLFSYLGGASASGATTAVDFTTGVFSLQKKIQLSETTAVGKTLTEVGVAHSASSSALLTHAMLKDMNGNQISIAKTDTDIINIYATIFVHFNPNGYANGSITFVEAGWLSITQSTSAPTVLYILAGGAAFPNQSSTYGSAGFEHGKGMGFEYGVSNTAGVTFTNISANKQVKGQATRLAAGANNVGGFGQVAAHGLRFVVKREGWFTGSVITGEAIGTGDGTTTDFALAFPWAEDAVIYIDGVAQTDGVAVASLPHTKTNCGGSELNAIDVNGNPAWLPKAMGDLYWSSWRTGTLYYENPYYATIGIKSVQMPSSACSLAVSNDFVNWTKVVSSSQYVEVGISAQYQNYRYWRAINNGTYERNGFFVYSWTKTKALHFDVPPAPGAVITADYTSMTIAKDANHVFDFSFTVQLGEKEGP